MRMIKQQTRNDRIPNEVKETSTSVVEHSSLRWVKENNSFSCFQIRTNKSKAIVYFWLNIGLCRNFIEIF
jgi:hypothetical protein